LDRSRAAGAGAVANVGPQRDVVAVRNAMRTPKNTRPKWTPPIRSPPALLGNGVTMAAASALITRQAPILRMIWHSERGPRSTLKGAGWFHRGRIRDRRALPFVA
jgi:hypothetical protein